MNFERHYFNQTNEENLSEVNWFKTRFLGNAFRKLAGSGKRRINPKDFKQMTELTGGGYAEMFGALDNRYSNQKKLKHFVKDLKTAVFKPKDAEGIFNTKQGPIDIKDPKQIKAASYYVTNKGGRIALFDIADEQGNDRYFIGIDGNALKFFNAPVKKGGMGKDFKTWLAAQSAKAYKPNKDVMSPEFEKKEEGKKIKMPHRFEISDADFEKFAPDEGTQPQEFKLAASNQSLDLFDVFNEDVLKEGKKVKYLIKKGDKWIVATGSGEEIDEPNPNHKYYAIKGTKTGLGRDEAKKMKDADLQKDLDDWVEKGLKDKESSEKKPEKKEDSEKPDIKQVGQIAVDLHDELQQAPNKVKATDIVKYGWRYLLKNGGTIFVYQRNDGKNMIAFDDRAKKTVEDKNLESKYGLEKAVVPE